MNYLKLEDRIKKRGENAFAREDEDIIRRIRDKKCVELRKEKRKKYLVGKRKGMITKQINLELQDREGEVEMETVMKLRDEYCERGRSESITENIELLLKCVGWEAYPELQKESLLTIIQVTFYSEQDSRILIDNGLLLALKSFLGYKELSNDFLFNTFLVLGNLSSGNKANATEIISLGIHDDIIGNLLNQESEEIVCQGCWALCLILLEVQVTALDNRSLTIFELSLTCRSNSPENIAIVLWTLHAYCIQFEFNKLFFESILNLCLSGIICIQQPAFQLINKLFLCGYSPEDTLPSDFLTEIISNLNQQILKDALDVILYLFWNSRLWMVNTKRNAEKLLRLLLNSNEDTQIVIISIILHISTNAGGIATLLELDVLPLLCIIMGQKNDEIIIISLSIMHNILNAQDNYEILRILKAYQAEFILGDLFLHSNSIISKKAESILCNFFS